MTGLEGEFRLGVVGATSAYFAQIQAWIAAFRKVAVLADAVSEIGSTGYDLYLVIVEDGATTATELEALVVQAGLTPCLVVAICDDDALVDAALAAGAVDFLLWETMDAVQLERVVRFALRRRGTSYALIARETYLAAARERDQMRLANVLHDGPLQDLIGARFLLGALPSADDATRSAVAEIQSSLQSVVQEVRSLCSELKPPALGPFGLEKAIRAHMQSFQSRVPDTEVSLELDGDDLQLPEWARLALFRILQAALSNIDNHAQATQIRVRLHLDDEQIHLTVADDGQGFEVPANWLEFAQAERCGLLMMQERVDALRGRLMVQSKPGNGTRVIVQVPLHQPSAPLPAFLSPAAPD